MGCSDIPIIWSDHKRVKLLGSEVKEAETIYFCIFDYFYREVGRGQDTVALKDGPQGKSVDVKSVIIIRWNNNNNNNNNNENDSFNNSYINNDNSNKCRNNNNKNNYNSNNNSSNININMMIIAVIIMMIITIIIVIIIKNSNNNLTFIWNKLSFLKIEMRYIILGESKKKTWMSMGIEMEMGPL